jgi:hypothetical protein
MKDTPSLLRTGLLQAALLIGLGFCHGLAAAATFTVTPSAVSNTYTGTITLQIGGLTNGETVVVQEFLDLNTNGVVEASDWLAQQFQLTDGLSSTIGGIVNSNVPADTTATNGTITARLSFQNNHVQSFIGKYLFRLSSPAGHFNPITSSFTVTNLPYVPGFKGTVKCGSTNVPNALVLLFKGQIFNSNLQAGTVADNSGNYLIKAPPGTYGLVALKNNYLPNTLTAPVLTLSSTTLTTNLSLVAATSTIAGTMVDAANPGTTLPGILMSANGPNDSMAISFTDAKGNFTLSVTSGQWGVSGDDLSLIAAGYVKSQNRITATAGQTGLTLAEPKATALFYGTVKDGAGKPIPGVDVYARDNNDDYETDGYSDVNGNYFVAVLGGLNSDPWHMNISNDGSPANYVYPEAPFEQYGGTNLTVGQTVRADFVALLATNQISGYLKDSGNHPITNVWIWASATINNASYGQGMDTDANGHYAINVCNGAWWVGVSCGGGDDSLGSQYLCPNSQMVTIVNKNTNVNFTALLAPSQISGYVKDTSNNPIANVGVYAYMPSGGGNGPGATTDGNGHYSFYVANGSWNVGLSCCGSQSLSPLGYLCVGEQSTSVYNSSSVVNFSVPHAPYQITGHLKDDSNNPIANVSVNASGNSYSACATTAADGSYTLYVNGGDWSINLECGALSSLGYLCPNGQSVTVSNANVVLDLSAPQAPYTITGWVRNSNNQPFTNLDVHASATIGVDNYWLDSHTDGNGNFSIQVANGQWWVGVDCGGLGSGYVCPDEVSVVIAGASVVTNFTIQSCGPLQIVTPLLPSGQVGSYYDFYLQASSCYPSFYWALFSPLSSLPPGLQFDSSGELYGTPTTNGTFNFTVQVTDGNNVTATQPLSLTILPALPDVVEYYVMKVDCFRQLDAVNLVPDTNNGPFAARMEIIQSGLGAVPIANVDLPSGGVRGFPPGSSGLELTIHETYPSQGAFDAVYTNGDYTFAMATLHNGFQYPVLTMPVAVYPAAPRVSNFSAAQAINPANPFTLQWSNPPDAKTNDVIWVFIIDAGGNMVFSTPYPPTNPLTRLKGTDTSVEVPANTCQPGGAYTGFIHFYRGISRNTTGYPGAVGYALVGVSTAFSLAAPSALPVLSQPTRISATQFGFLLSGAAGTNYTVFASTNAALPLSNWSPVLTTNLPGSSAFIQDNQATTQRRYYRVKVGP